MQAPFVHVPLVMAGEGPQLDVRRWRDLHCSGGLWSGQRQRVRVIVRIRGIAVDCRPFNRHRLRWTVILALHMAQSRDLGRGTGSMRLASSISAHLQVVQIKLLNVRVVYGGIFHFHWIDQGPERVDYGSHMQGSDRADWWVVVSGWFQRSTTRSGVTEPGTGALGLRLSFILISGFRLRFFLGLPQNLLDIYFDAGFLDFVVKDWIAYL